PVSVVGTESLTNGGSITGTPNLTGAALVADPYAGVAYPPPPTGGCLDGNSINPNKDPLPLNQGKYCNGFDFQGKQTIILNPGTYYVQKMLKILNQVTVNGTSGVTLIIDYSGGNYSVIINNSTLNLTAPVSGTYAGLVFLGPRNSSPSVIQSFGNGDTLN